MKKIISATLTLSMLVTTLLGHSTFKGLPLIQATSEKGDYRIGIDWIKASWTISPQIESDTLRVLCHSKCEDFAFFTNRDSIKLKIKPDQIQKFYIALNGSAYALTIVKGIKSNYEVLEFDKKPKNGKLKFWYEQNIKNEYLNLLRSRYPIDSIANTTKTDTQKTLKILNWVHNQWQHNGNNEPKKNDAISILEEVKEGKNFRCVEYGIVATACLNAIGLQARTLGLKTKDVETQQSGAGHVLLEVFLNDLKKWVLIDGQWDAMPVMNGVPLNAVEFQRAIVTNYEILEIWSLSGISKRNYIEWIFPYLYYFDISLDNRAGLGLVKNKINDKRALMLVPIGKKEPTVFQINYKIDYCLYTNSLKDFYAPPDNFVR